MPFPITLNGRVYTSKDFDGLNYVKGIPDAMQDFVTHAANIHSATSTSSLTIATGPKALTIQAGKPWKVGAPLRVSRTSAPSTQWMDGVVTAYNDTTGAMTVDVTAFAGSGTFTDWSVNVGGGGALVPSNPVLVAQGGTGATTAAAARVALSAVGGPTGTNVTEINRLVLWNAADGTLTKNGPALGNAGEALVSQGPGQPPAFVSIVGALVGEIKLWPVASPPSGWVICNGQALSRTTFAGLFAVLGTLYGAGDGATTFNVPDLRGRVAIGAGQGAGLTNRVLGTTGGEEAHALTQAETPVKAHTHSFSATTTIESASHTHTTDSQGGHQHVVNGSSAAPVGYGAGGNTATQTASIATSFAGDHTHTTGGPSANHTHNVSGTANSTSDDAAAAHNTMQPWVALNHIIKT